MADAKPLSQNAYKVTLARVAVKRALLEAAKRVKAVAMERPGLTKVSMNRCEKLRWKGMFIEAEWDPTIQHCNDRAFWCQHTLKLPRAGRQGRATTSSAVPARSCYEQL